MKNEELKYFDIKVISVEIKLKLNIITMSKDSRCTQSKSKTRTEGRIDQYLSERVDAKSQAEMAQDNMCDQHRAAILQQALDSEDESKHS